MSRRTVEQANQYVREVETQYVRDLVKKVGDAEQRAESKHNGGCGCSQCKKMHKRLQRELQDELAGFFTRLWRALF